METPEEIKAANDLANELLATAKTKGAVIEYLTVVIMGHILTEENPEMFRHARAIVNADRNKISSEV